MNQFKITFVIGDWSDDGHGRTVIQMINSNLTHKQIRAAYKKGVKKIGFDLVNETARHYDDAYIRHEQYEMLRSQGFETELNDWQKQEDVDGDGIDLDFDFYFSMYLFFVLKGNPKFTYEIIEDEQINIGGYGLFG